MNKEEIRLSNALSSMIDYIKSSVKNDIASQCKDIDRKDLEKIVRIAEISIQHAYVNSAETVLAAGRK
jgi:hypothetical protein